MLPEGTECGGRNCTTVLHDGSVCHLASTLLKSGTNVNETKISEEEAKQLYMYRRTQMTGQAMMKKKKNMSDIIYGDSQYVGDYADAPQIGGRRDGFVSRHFG